MTKTPTGPWTRKNKVTVQFNDGELADLKVIAEAWEVTVGETIWAVMATWLSNRRGREIMKLPYHVRARKVLDRARGSEVEIAQQREEDQGGAWPDEGPGSGLRRDLYGDDWENREGGSERPDEVDPEPGV